MRDLIEHVRVRHDLPRAPLLLLVHGGRRPDAPPRAVPQRRRVLPRPARRHAALAHRQAARTVRRRRSAYLDDERAAGLDRLRLLRATSAQRVDEHPATTCVDLLDGAEGRRRARSPPTAPPPRAARCSTTSGIGTDLVDFVVDRNVHKQGLLHARRAPADRDPRGAARGAARLRADPGLELQGRDHRPAGRVPARRGGRFIVPVPSPESCRGRTARSRPPSSPARPAARRRPARRSTSSRRHPGHSCLLLDSRDEARRAFPRGDLGLALLPSLRVHLQHRVRLRRCTEYSARYEETQGFSPRFQRVRAATWPQRWVERYDLRGKTVLEIGCGKGEFLAIMCEAGAGHGHRHRPGAHAERHRRRPAPSASTLIADFYAERTRTSPADAVVCRHTLEHIAPVARVHRPWCAARSATARDTVVLFELPDVARVLEEAAFWDIYYEHCSYFIAGSLARLFRRDRLRGRSTSRSTTTTSTCDRGPAVRRAGRRRAARDRGRPRGRCRRRSSTTSRPTTPRPVGRWHERARCRARRRAAGRVDLGRRLQGRRRSSTTLGARDGRSSTRSTSTRQARHVHGGHGPRDRRARAPRRRTSPTWSWS